MNLGQLINTVQQNCHISDARFAGNYTMCIFLLRMREYYRWENEIPLSERLPSAELGDWLAAREETWNRLESHSFSDLPLEHGAVDPFDAGNINSELLPQGYVYSGGYGLFHKPLFFLGELSKQDRRDGITVLVSSCEYARDLVAPPAMVLGDTIFVRQDALRRFLWEKIEEWRWNKRQDSPIARALACYAPEEELESLLDAMVDNETETVILHEFGESKAGKLLGPDWERMLGALSGSKTEFAVRAVRDHLADCLTTLPALVETGNTASIHLYFANFTGIRKELFPSAMDAYRCWLETDSLESLKESYHRGQDEWLQTADAVLRCFRSRGKDARVAIEHLLRRKD